MYRKHNVSGENLMYCLSCRSTARYADAATFEGHGLPVEGGRAGFKVRIYFDRLCKIFDGCSKMDRKIAYSLLPKTNFFSPIKVVLSHLLNIHFYMYMKCFNKIVY